MAAWKGSFKRKAFVVAALSMLLSMANVSTASAEGTVSSGCMSGVTLQFSGITENSISVSWVDPCTDEAFNLVRRVSPSAALVTASAAAGTGATVGPVTFSGLACGTTYGFRGSASLANGTESSSSVQYATTVACGGGEDPGDDPADPAPTLEDGESRACSALVQAMSRARGSGAAAIEAVIARLCPTT